MFPESFTFSIADWVNGWVDSLVTNYGDVFRQHLRHPVVGHRQS